MLHYANELLERIRLAFQKLYLFLAFVQFFGLVIAKKKLTLGFYASVLLLKINFVILLSKFAEEPLACGSWFHGLFDNDMMQSIINKRTDTKN